MDLFLIFLILNIGILLVITLTNFTDLPRIKNSLRSIDPDFKVSILIPARNEENNIKNIIEDSLNLAYENIEIIIYNDQSSDSTQEIIKSYIDENQSKIKLINGSHLPPKWTGKNWACFNLAKEATGDYLLFVDADVRLARQAVSNAIYLFNKNKLNLLSVFPTQKMKSIGEHLIVPLMNFLLLAILPMTKIYGSSNYRFAAANGQFMLFDKKSYWNFGGHESVKDSVVEDVEIAKTIKKNGSKLMTILGDSAVSCRMYNNFNEALNGFAKNFYSGFNLKPLVFLIGILYFEVLFLFPAIISIYNFDYLMPVMLIVVMRIIISIQSSQNIVYNVALHIPQTIIFFVLGIFSTIQTLTKKSKWKGRSVNA